MSDLDPDAQPPYDAGDPGAVRRKTKAARRHTAEQEAVIRQVLGTPAARAWMWQVISACGVFRAEFVGGEALQFATGQRNIGLMLLGQVPTDLYKMMSDEANEAQDNG